MTFHEGERFSRMQISQMLGGNPQQYLPTVGGRVVAICVDPASNPRAPYEILPGRGPTIEHTARMLARQREALPCFLKRGNAVWEYVGNFRPTSISVDWALLAAKTALVGRTVTSVITLEKLT
jgi:hypothetical protein